MVAQQGLTDVAERFIAARKTSIVLSEFPGPVPQSLRAAYGVQDAALALIDDAVVGWKVGRLDAQNAARLRVDRLTGPVLKRSLQQLGNGADPIGRVFAGGFGAVEAEFVFRIGLAPDEAQRRFTVDDAAALVDAVFVGFEIASSPYARINADGPLVTISDFGNNNGLLVGPEIRDWRSSALADWTVVTEINDVEQGRGTASAFTDGPLGSVRFLLENLASRAIPITPGLLVSTGAVSGVHPVAPGDRVRADFGDFARIECGIGAVGAALMVVTA